MFGPYPKREKLYSKEREFRKLQEYGIMTDGTDYRKAHLDSLLDDLAVHITETGKRYFHVKSVANLIFHFDAIKSETDKKWVYESLINYFEACKFLTPSIDRDQSKTIFNDYLDKITDYYATHLGFSLLINRGVVYVLYCLSLAIASFYFSVKTVAIIGLIFAAQIIYTLNKTRLKKVYGMYY